MRICNRCKIEKPLDEFSFKNKERGIKHGYCKKCGRFYLKSHYEKNKKYYLLKAYKRNKRIRSEIRKYLHDYLKKHPCLHCGEKDPIVLEFDHLPNFIKTSDVSILGRNHNLNTIKEEIVKCQVLCANCHRRKTAK